MVPFIMIKGYKFALEYGGLYFICFNCDKYDHKIECCSKYTETTTMLKPHALRKTHEEDPTLQTLPDPKAVVISPKETKKSSEEISNAVTKDRNEETCFNPWMLVKRPPCAQLKERKQLLKKRRYFPKI